MKIERGLESRSGHIAVRTNAKLLLFGEHAAVWGYPAVGLSLENPLTLSYQAGDAWKFPTASQAELEVLSGLVDRFQNWRKEEGKDPLNPGELRVNSKIPTGCGFGSSAALCAAFAKLFLAGAPESGPRSWDARSREAEKVFHGQPSGIDTTLALREGWWRMVRRSDELELDQLPDRRPILVAGALPRSTTTKKLVQTLAARREEHPRHIESRLKRLGMCAERATQTIRTAPKDLEANLGALFEEAQTELAALGLSSETLDQVLSLAKTRTGALGGKLSGAGGGGAFVLAYPDEVGANRACGYLIDAFPPSFWALPPRRILASRTQE